MRVVKHAEGERIEPAPGWRRIRLAGSDSVSIEYFDKPPGHASPRHRHVQEQTCIVIRGRLCAIGADDERIELGPGDSVWFAPNEFHAIENSGDEAATGVDIFVPARSAAFWTEQAQAADRRDA
ncbi:MAG: cupin domain-containing protein [bacterium]|nr:cupin domain-containing protein [bacterium]